MTYDRFEFEDQLMNTWAVTKDMKDLYTYMLEQDVSKDTICNILIGLCELYDMKFDKLFRLFEASLKEGK